MKLMLPLIIDAIERRALLIVPRSGPSFTIDSNSKKRPTHFLPLMDKAAKFIFDSGSDKNDLTTNTVRETAVNMLEAGLFHLPSPITWIEDYFEDETSMRFYYLCTEDESGISVNLLQGVPRSKAKNKNDPRFCVVDNSAFISFENVSNNFSIPICDPLVSESFAEAIYSIKKFVVCLNTEDIEREHVKGSFFKASLPKKFRHYEHSIVRVPLQRPGPIDESPGVHVMHKRRKHLVRGYIWGKNTRPLDQQRWIKPCFRGSQDVGETSRDHYVVKVR